MICTRWNREHTQRAGTTIYHALWNRETHLTLEQRCVVHAGTENTLSALGQRFSMRSGTEKHI